jgi:hypothetical protein
MQLRMNRTTCGVATIKKDTSDIGVVVAQDD